MSAGSGDSEGSESDGGGAALDGSGRVDEFRAEISELRLRDPRATHDRRSAVLGGTLMILALIIEIGAYLYSSNGNELEQRDAIVIAIAGLTVGVIGSALFAKASMTQFLRWWLARLTYEQKHQTDRIIDADRD